MTSRTAQRRASSSVRDAHEPSKPKWLLPAIVIGVVAIAAILAIAIAGRGNKAADTGGLQQVQPVAVSGTPLPTLSDPNNDSAVGMTIPTITGKSFDGTPVTIAPTGSPQLILFVAHWCPHCQREVPLLSEWMKQGSMPAGVQLTTVATGTSADAPNYPPSAWLQKNDWPSPIMADSTNSDAAQAMGLPGYPYFVLVDGDGKVVARTSGEISTDQLETMLKSLVAQSNG
ncbi:MAG TPA: TlpA disulfide reductase family protein [Acidimicrobiales bacterium]|nr:TlpA disulfide reductase family protein [Acidimicrobiales bacterium]